MATLPQLIDADMQRLDAALAFDHKAIKTITLIGIPSAFLLHGYVGFIFGSVKANPWWGSVLMPIVFLMSAIVSGIAMVIVLFMVITAEDKIADEFSSRRV